VKDLAEMPVPGIPATVQGLRIRATREGWTSRPRRGKGGGVEYCVQSLLKRLPEDARAALLAALVNDIGSPSEACGVQADGLARTGLQKAGIEVMTAGKVPAPLIQPTADWQRRCAEARMAILIEVERLAALAGVNRAVEQIVAMARDGELRPDLQELVPLANARGGKSGKRTLSRRSIFRWRADAARGVDALAPYQPEHAAPPAWAATLLKLYNAPQKRSLAAVVDDLPDYLPEGVPVPSYDAARRFLLRVSVVDRERGRNGPNALLKYKAFKRRSTEGLPPLAIVTADGHTFKADVAHPRHGKPFRPEVCTLQDVATRYVFGWSIGLAESSIVVMDAIRHGVESLGMFGVFYTDNGSGFVSEAMTAEVTGFLSRLHASPTNSMPGRAQARGKIERLQKSLWGRAAQKLPTYSARAMDNEARRKVVKLVQRDLKERGGSRLLMEWDEFRAFCAAEIAAYNNRPHRGLPRRRDEVTGTLRHLSPAEALAEARAEGWEPVTLPAEALADLWRPYEIRITSRGEVKLPWGRYFSEALVPFGGEQVRVGYDIHDGTKVWVRTMQTGQLICIAERDANVIPEQPASKVEHALRHRAKGRAKLLNDHLQEVRAELHGGRLIEHSAEQPFNARVDAVQREIEAEWSEVEEVPTAPAKASAARTIDTRETRIRRALDIEERIAAELPVSAEDRRWFSHYSTHPEFSTAKAMIEDFGEAALA